jgi:WD40 repeat protein
MFASHCYENSNLLIWATGNDYQCLKILIEEISSICSIDNTLFIGSHEGIKIFDITNNFEYLHSLSGHNNKEVISLLYVEKNKLLLSGSDNTIQVWDVTNGFHCIKTIEIGKITNLVFLRNGYFAVCHKGRVTIWDLVILECIGKLDGLKGDINQLCLMGDAMVITSIRNNAVIIWGY